MICKHCGSDIMVKDGMVAGKQRWKCTKCKKTTREGDKRRKYDIWKIILAVKLYSKGKSIEKISSLLGISRPLIRYWLKNYETIMKKEFMSVSFPRNAKNFLIKEQRYFKQLRDDYGFNEAYGIIFTDKLTFLFIMD